MMPMKRAKRIIMENNLFLAQRERYCKICFKRISRTSFYNFMNHNCEVCDECLSKMSAKFHYFTIKGYKGMAIFDYDSFLRQLTFQYKGCYDIELKRTFLERYIYELKTLYYGYILIPAPSYYSEDETRQFNHVIEIFKMLGLKIEKVFKKSEPFKQAEHNANERKNIKKHIVLDATINLENKKLLIVDDIITTGSTVSSMIEMLEKLNPKEIKILVICKTIHKTTDT